MKDTFESILHISVVIIFIAIMAIGFGTCKKWRYDECIEIGHSPNYCTAQALGCFDDK
jgi:hypothetical protein